MENEMLGMYICKIINEMGISIMTYFFCVWCFDKCKKQTNKKNAPDLSPIENLRETPDPTIRTS